MYKIGQKVRLNEEIGYIVKIEINPLEEIDVAFEAKDWIIYTIRVYKRFCLNGYTDYYCTEKEIQ